MSTTASAPFGGYRWTNDRTAVGGATGCCRDTCSSEACRVPAVGTPHGNANAATSPMSRRSPNPAPCLTVVARFEATEPATLAVCRGYCPLSLAAVSHPSVNGPIARCRQAVCRGLLVPLPGDAFGVRPLRVAAQAARGALRGSRCWAHRSAWWSLPRGLAVQLQTSGQCVIWCARLASSRSD